MPQLLAAALVCAVLIASEALCASGMLGVYGIVDKVVFEPDERAPERIQLWGSFALVESGVRIGLTISEPKRGYLYLRMPYSGHPHTQAIRNEWADFKAMAGTGQAIGFGSWAYIGAFSALRTDVSTRQVPYIIEQSAGRPRTDLRVRPASEAPSTPALYETNLGIVKLSATGSHAEIVKRLRDAR